MRAQRGFCTAHHLNQLNFLCDVDSMEAENATCNSLYAVRTKVAFVARCIREYQEAIRHNNAGLQVITPCHTMVAAAGPVDW